MWEVPILRVPQVRRDRSSDPKGEPFARETEAVCCRRSSGGGVDIIAGKGSAAHGMFGASSWGMLPQPHAKGFTNCSSLVLIAVLWQYALLLSRAGGERRPTGPETYR